MLKRVDMQSVFDIGRLVIWVTMLGVIVTEALTLITGITMVAFPDYSNADFLRDMGNTLSACLFGVSNVVMLVMAHRFVKNVILVGTPFTHVCAQRMKNLAVLCACCYGASLLGSYVVDFVVKIPVPEARLTDYSGLVLAAVLFVAAFVLEAGAKQEEKLEQYRLRITELQRGKSGEEK